MNITAVNNKINLHTIRLNSEEEVKALRLLAKLKSDIREELKDSIKLELFDIFEKHLNDKAYNVRKFTILEDYRQKMFLTFFELLEKVKNQDLLPENFLKQIDSLKPDKECISPAFIKDTVSITKQPCNKKSCEKLSYAGFLTEEHLPVYAAAPDDEKIQQDKEALSSVLNSSFLEPLEVDIMLEKGAGKTGIEISRLLGQNYERVLRLIRTSVLKIQDKNNILPEDFQNFIIDFKNKCSPECSHEDLKDFFIKNSLIQNYDEALFKIEQFAELFQIDIKAAANLYLQKPFLFRSASSTLYKRCEDFAKLCNIDIEKAKNIFLNNAFLLDFPSGYIKQFIDDVVSEVNIDKDKFSNKLYQHIKIIRETPENIKNNIEENSKMLGISSEKYKQHCLLSPKLFCYKKEFLEEKIQKISSILNISKEELVKYIKFQPVILVLKPETIYTNVENLANAFEISFEEAVKLSLHNPILMYSKLDTVTYNLDNAAELIGMDKKEYYKIASRQPTIITRKPNSISENVENYLKLFDITKEEYFKVLDTYPMLIYVSANEQLHRAKLVQLYKKIKKKETFPLKETMKTNLSVNNLYLSVLYLLIKQRVKDEEITRKNFLKYLQDHPGVDFNIIMPKHEMTEEVIDFIKSYSMENFNRQRFNFTILEQ